MLLGLALGLNCLVVTLGNCCGYPASVKSNVNLLHNFYGVIKLECERIGIGMVQDFKRQVKQEDW